MTEAQTFMNVETIMQKIPHRYPFLLIDRVKEVVKDEYAVALKNVTINEQFFIGHFPRMPVMPGVLIIEAFAQTGAVLVVETLGKESEGKLVYFMSIEEAKFRKPVVPGDQIVIKVSKVQARRNVWKIACEGTVDGQKVAEAVITAMILDN